jgi:hypothetical protein
MESFIFINKSIQFLQNAQFPSSCSKTRHLISQLFPKSTFDSAKVFIKCQGTTLGTGGEGPRISSASPVWI